MCSSDLVRAEHEFEEVYPQDEVPATLNFQDLQDTELVHELDVRTFEEWLSEGRHNCDIAQALLHVWTSTMRGSHDDTLHDFFTRCWKSSRSSLTRQTLLAEPCHCCRWRVGF